MPRKNGQNKRQPTGLPHPTNQKESTAKYKIMTPGEFAKMRGVSIQAVCKPLRKGDLQSETLKGVKSFSKISRFYLLKVDMELAMPLHLKAQRMVQKTTK